MLPLTVKDVTDVVTAHPIAIPRSTLDYIIFELDDLERIEQRQAKRVD